MRNAGYLLTGVATLFVLSAAGTMAADGNGVNHKEGKRLFERETFGGNGRTCSTCHGAETGTVSPADARKRLAKNPSDPLFLHDGSDDGAGNGTVRILQDATIRVEIPLPQNVVLADDQDARSVVVARGIPTTLNTPATDPVLMLDGRQPTLAAQALGALHDHAQALTFPTGEQLKQLTEFEKSEPFFSSDTILRFARGGVVPTLPPGKTASQKRGRRFFEDVFDPTDLKAGLCGACHAGPMLNETGLGALAIAGVPLHSRFQSVLVSELNPSHAPVRDFVFTNPDNTTTHVVSPDPGRALITGNAQDANQFKIPTLWGVAQTAPYFHDNSAKTLEDLVNHYATFFAIASDLDGPGPMPPLITLTPQDRADLVAYMKLLE
jgi:cytochrome c peroxidase